MSGSHVAQAPVATGRLAKDFARRPSKALGTARPKEVQAPTWKKVSAHRLLSTDI